jgi:hypothetical protein
MSGHNRNSEVMLSGILFRIRGTLPERFVYFLCTNRYLSITTTRSNPNAEQAARTVATPVARRLPRTL